MLETLAPLLAAHLVGDFVLQFDWIIRRKRSLAVLFVHVAIVTAVSALFLGALHWQILAAIFVTHFAMDAIKTYLLNPRTIEVDDDTPETRTQKRRRSLRDFSLDQIVHIAVLIILADLYPNAADTGLYDLAAPALWEGPDTFLFLMITLSGVITAVFAGGHLIGYAVGILAVSMDSTPRGLPSGGKVIGWLERALVVLFTLVNQPAGVGFLIATKSILRFGEATKAAVADRHVSEYIIIGTFMSFGWALLVALLMKAGLDAL